MEHVQKKNFDKYFLFRAIICLKIANRKNSLTLFAKINNARSRKLYKNKKKTEQIIILKKSQKRR